MEIILSRTLPDVDLAPSPSRRLTAEGFSHHVMRKTLFAVIYK